MVDTCLVDDDNRVGGLPMGERHERAIDLLMPVHGVASSERDAEMKVAAVVAEHFLLGETRNNVARSAEIRLGSDSEMREMVGQVALVAAQLHEGRRVVGAELVDGKVAGEHNSLSPATLAETIESLDVKDGMKVALLVLFEQVDKTGLDKARVNVVKAEARQSINRRVGRRYKDFPLLMQLAGDSRNGRSAHDFSEIVDRHIQDRSQLDSAQKWLMDDSSARQAVHDAFSDELLSLLDSPTPRLYNYS